MVGVVNAAESRARSSKPERYAPANGVSGSPPCFGTNRFHAARSRHERLMQMPAGRKHVRKFRSAHERGVIAVAVAICFTADGTTPCHRPAHPFAGANINSTWLGPNSSSTDVSSRPSASTSRRRMSNDGLDAMETLLGEVLIAVMNGVPLDGGVPGWPPFFEREIGVNPAA